MSQSFPVRSKTLTVLLILYKIASKVDPSVIPANSPQCHLMSETFIHHSLLEMTPLNFTYCESEPSHLTAVESRNILV